MKITLYNGLYRFRVELLAGEHVQVHVVVFLYKVSDNVRRFYKLNESVPRFVSCAKVNYLRFAVRHHTNLLDQFVGEGFYVARTPNRGWATTSGVDDSMQTPYHYLPLRDYSNQLRLLF